MLRSLPNWLAFFRILTTPLLIWLIVEGGSAFDLSAAVLLLAMAISDIIDGPLARRMGVVSVLGVFLDTISDKIFVAGAMIPLVQRGLLPAWIAVLIVGRDYVISALRSFASARGVVISARRWGKQKLVLTCIALIMILLRAHVDGGGALAQMTPIVWLLKLTPVMLGLAVLWTLGSALDYLTGAWGLLRSSWAPDQAPDAAPSTLEG